MKKFSTKKLGLHALGLFVMLIVAGGPVAGTEVPGDFRFTRSEAETISEAGGAFPPSVFSHWMHRIRYRCDACHERLFSMEQGATQISMELIAEGKVCGACHDGRRAFDDSFENCSRCHQAVVE